VLERPPLSIAPLLLCLWLAGCGRADEPTPSSPAQSAQPVADIAWFDGSIDAAFAAAAAEHKPVFLYWGARWCPPCHELKAYVFSRPDFRDRMRQFVPVYLDGDAPGAQRLAEAFGVVG
jgi:thiol:disulfide interchange protein